MSSSDHPNDHLVDVENTTPTPPSSPTGSDGELYPVEKLCKERYDEEGKRWFKVKWEGTTEKSWEPVENVAACLVEEFERKKKRKLWRKMEKGNGSVGGNSGKAKAGDGSSSDDVILIDSIKNEVDLPQFPCDFKGCVKVFVSLSSLKQHKTKVHFPKVVKEPSKKTVVKDSGRKEVAKDDKRKGDICKTKHKKGHTVTSIKEETMVELESIARVDVFGSEGNSGTGTNFGSQDFTPIIIDVIDENEAAASESPTEGCFPETQVTEGGQEAEDLPITATTVNTVDSNLSLSLVISSDSETEQGQMNTSDTFSSEVSNDPTTPAKAKKRKVAERDDQDQPMDIAHIKVESEVSEDVKPTSDALYIDWKRVENQYLDKLKNESEEWKRLYEMEKKSRVKNERDFKEKLKEYNSLKADLNSERSARLAEAAKVQDLECKLKEEQNKIQALKMTLGEALGKL